MSLREEPFPEAQSVVDYATARWSMWPSRPAPWMVRGRRLPIGPLRWAIVQPNAAGFAEMASTRGLFQRQWLKATGQYLGERLLVVAGEHSVSIWPLVGRYLALPRLGDWPTDRLLAVPVTPAVDRVWPAVQLVDLETCRLLAEVRGVRADDHTRAVFAALRP